MTKLENIKNIHGYIYRLRGQQVMLDRDLAQLYGVPTKSLNLSVHRNPSRFPKDFMFQLSSREAADLRFQNETSRWGGRRYFPYVFAEEGIAMLSSVLRSERAALVNVAIMRAFVKLRRALASSQDITRRVEKIEGKVNMHETDIGMLVQAVIELRKRPGPSGPIEPEIL